MKRLILLGIALLLSTVLAAQQSGLTTAQIQKPSADSWPTYNGDYSGRRFSTLTKINAANVKHLSLAWFYDLAGGGGGLKATPLQVDGVLYFTTPDHAYAVEARTGRELWHYTWTRNRGGIHIGNRGVAVLGDSVYFVTPDCNLVALDIKTGQEKWFKEICSIEMMYLRVDRAGRREGSADRRRERRRPRPAGLSRRARSQDRRADLALVRDAAEGRTIPGSRPGRTSTWPSTAAA